MKSAPKQNVGDISLPACNLSSKVSIKIFPNISKLCTPYCGRIGFKEYNPCKSAKYGLLYCSLCDATVPYTYFSLPYLVSWKFSIKKIQQQEATMLLELMSTLNILSMAFSPLPICLFATSLWIDILLLSH